MSKVVGNSETPKQEEMDVSKLKADRLKKLGQLKELGINPYPYKFERSHLASQLHEIYKEMPKGSENEDQVTVCGRRPAWGMNR